MKPNVPDIGSSPSRIPRQRLVAQRMHWQRCQLMLTLPINVDVSPTARIPWRRKDAHPPIPHRRPMRWTMFFNESLRSLRGGFLYTKRLCSIQGGNTVQSLGLLSPRLALCDTYCPEPVWPTSSKEWVQSKQ